MLCSCQRCVWNQYDCRKRFLYSKWLPTQGCKTSRSIFIFRTWIWGSVNLDSMMLLRLLKDVTCSSLFLSYLPSGFTIVIEEVHTRSEQSLACNAAAWLNTSVNSGTGPIFASTLFRSFHSHWEDTLVKTAIVLRWQNPSASPISFSPSQDDVLRWVSVDDPSLYGGGHAYSIYADTVQLRHTFLNRTRRLIVYIIPSEIFLRFCDSLVFVVVARLFHIWWIMEEKLFWRSSKWPDSESGGGWWGGYSNWHGCGRLLPGIVSWGAPPVG